MSVVQVSQETSPGNDLRHGHVVVGATPQRLANSMKLNRGVLIRAPGSSEEFPNQHAIWVGGPGVTADNSVTGGIPILPNSALFIPIDDPSLLWIVSDAEDQDLAWIGM